MARVLESLVLDHDLSLVLLAAAVCTFGAIATTNVSARAARMDRRSLWLTLLSICAGATVWATHFIAMLAYRQGIPTTYDPGLTALSFMAGVGIMGAGFALAVHVLVGWIYLVVSVSCVPRVDGAAAVPNPFTAGKP